MFSIDNSVSTSVSRLEGNKIHNVRFLECLKDVVEIKSGDNAGKKSNVLKIKFISDEGVFEHTIWEPSAADARRTEGQFGTQPARTEEIAELYKMLLEAVNPTRFEKIKTGEVKLAPKTWGEMQDLFVNVTDSKAPVETSIKLLKDSKGNSTFPSYFVGIGKDGKSAYRKTTFIGKNLSFTASEAKKMTNVNTAKSSSMPDLNLGDATTDTSSLNLSVSSLNDLDI